MKIITFNANGIRSAYRKGFFTWLHQQNADIICIQETKAQQTDLVAPHFCPEGYHCFFSDAKKRGYSGVAIYSKIKPDHVTTTMGLPLCEEEGRYLQIDFPDLSVVSVYIPSGSSGEGRQAIKMQFLSDYFPVLKKQLHANRNFIICGDWNIVHKEIDIKNWKSNQKNSGCLPEERAWLDSVFDEKGLGWVDAFRVINHEKDQYTWWSHRANARAKNVGWRIDYQVVSPALKSQIKKVEIVPTPFFSDHAPLIVEYGL